MVDGRGADATRGDVGISVVIPARNAERTLGTPLGSLLAQSHVRWEAVVVDDGSTDDTVAAAHRAAGGDPRIRVVSQPSSGVSAARNRGLAEASHDFVLFLDADDHIEPSTFQLVAEALRAQPGLDGVRYDWALESGAGERLARTAVGLRADGANLFEVASLNCPFAMHTCVIRRDRVTEVGGFDETLRAAEDWDLWQRLGRRGVRLGYVPQTLAYYVQHTGSATHKDFARVLTDCLRVVDRLHAPDARVPRPAPEHAEGAPAEHAAWARRQLFLWVLALAIGADVDVQPVLDAFPNPGRGTVLPEHAAEVLHTNVPVGAGYTLDEWAVVLPLVGARLDRAIAELAAWDGDPVLADRVRRRLEVLVLASGGGAVARFGETCCEVIDLDEPVTDRRPDGATRWVGLARLGGAPVGRLELPVIGGVVAAQAIREAIADQLGLAVVRQSLRSRHRVANLVGGGARALVARRTWRAAAGTRPPTLAVARQELKGFAKHLATEAVRRSTIAGARSTPSDEPAVVAPGPTRSSRPAGRGVTLRLPILMYHRVADEGPEALAQYRVPPEQFAAQLDLLRRHGFETISLDEWADATGRGLPVRGRRVAITFDDGYLDVFEHARPLLDEHGFSATVFVIPELAGDRSVWDADLGAPARLMGWDELRSMHAGGFTIGSHTLGHRHLTAQTPDAVLAQERRARQVIGERLGGAQPTVIAYPYGDIDPAQRFTIAAAGYRVGVTTRHGEATRFDHPLNLCRLDVPNGLPLEQFALLVGAGDGS